MIDLIPARPEMIGYLEVQDAQVATGQLMSPYSLAQAIGGGLALAAVEEGRLLGIGGLFTLWEDRALAWTLLAKKVDVRMTCLHRIVARGLAHTSVRRVEAYVADVHEEGHRWMQLLGMEKEGVMRCFWQGRDHTLYAKVR